MQLDELLSCNNSLHGKGGRHDIHKFGSITVLITQTVSEIFFKGKANFSVGEGSGRQVAFGHLRYLILYNTAFPVIKGNCDRKEAPNSA